MINFPKIDNQVLKIQAARQVYSKQIIPVKLDKNLNPKYANQDFSFKALASQVHSTAGQDNLNPVGRKLNFFA
jgi:hypothetical protein